MNTLRLSVRGSLPVNLWHRFNIWRAKRMYREVIDMAAKAEWLKTEADELMRRHAEDPQRSLFGND